MSLWFKPLFTLSVSHEYYGGACPDFEFLIPESTRAFARNGRLLVRHKENKLYCIYEADDAGDAVQQLAGESMCIGLRLRNPNFSNFTELDIPELTALYRNLAAADKLDNPLGVRLVGSVIPHEITKGARPVTLRLENPDGVALQTRQVSSKKQTHFSYATGLLEGGGGLNPGYYVVRETYPATSGETHYYLKPELLSAGAFGVVDIRLANGFYSAPPDFEVKFTAKNQKLKYYVVARKYGDADFEKLAVSDHGFVEDQRSEVKFTKVASESFTTDDLSPHLIGSNEDKIAVFKSNTAQVRQARGRSKIQLRSNNDVLIQHLPAPTEHQAQADLIIHVAKP